MSGYSAMDCTADLQSQVAEACAARQALQVIGGNTKAFFGRPPTGVPLHVSGHRGIVSYEPSELVITARSGTPVDEIEEALADRGQMLPFEPPQFTPGGTLGGAIAAGLGGPRRPWGGAPRDLVLGVKLLDGRGRILRFGGQVMKNVAGYDLSRLMAGAMGTLGVLLEVSLKVLPRPAAERSLALELGSERALALMRSLSIRPLPITGAAHDAGRLLLRLAGSASTLEDCRRFIGGSFLASHDDFWIRLRDHRLDFFADGTALWRLSVPPGAPHPLLSNDAIIDWGGAQRWVKSSGSAAEVRAAVEKFGGHAILFRYGNRSDPIFQPLAAPLERLHKRLKQTFDPFGILNPGRLYAEW
jgi:glycolate oxidase FAD binding subunit